MIEDEETRAYRALWDLARWITDHRGDLFAIEIGIDGQDSDVIAQAMFDGLQIFADAE